jgi:hypothetical protein
MGTLSLAQYRVDIQGWNEARFRWSIHCGALALLLASMPSWSTTFTGRRRQGRGLSRI